MFRGTIWLNSNFIAMSIRGGSFNDAQSFSVNFPFALKIEKMFYDFINLLAQILTIGISRNYQCFS